MILNVDAGVDYRLRVLKQAQLFKTHLQHEDKLWMYERFSALTQVKRSNTRPIIINNRIVEMLGHTKMYFGVNFQNCA